MAVMLARVASLESRIPRRLLPVRCKCMNAPFVSGSTAYAEKLVRICQ
jgi:hypothetical protein